MKDPRTVSGLPKKFTYRECAAYVYLLDRQKRFLVDMVSKSVLSGSGGSMFENLVECAKFYGWDG